MVSPGAITGIVAKLSGADFHFDAHRWVFEACRDMDGDGRPVSPATVSRYLAGVSEQGESRLAAMGGLDAVVALVEGVDPGELDEWADRVVEARRKRELFEVTNRLRELASSDDIEAAITESQEIVLELTADRRQANSAFASGLDQFREKSAKYLVDPEYVSGIATGWKDFDRTLDGFQPGNLYVIYGPTSGFKSFIVQNMGHMFARSKRAGIWFTTEMAGYQVIERLVQFESERNVRWLRRDGKFAGQYDRIQNAADRVSELRQYIELEDEPEVDLETLSARIMQGVRNGAEYAIVDLMDMVTTRSFSGQQTANASAVVRGVKKIARKAEIPIIGTTHVRKQERPLKGKNGEPPPPPPIRLDLDEMKDTNTKATDADAAVSLMPVKWGEGGWYGLTSEQVDFEKSMSGILTIMVSITKNRQGDRIDLPFTMNLNLGGRMWPMVRGVADIPGVITRPGASMVSQNVIDSYQPGSGNT